MSKEFDKWLNLYTERMDDTPGLTQFGKESWDACKKEVLEILDKYRHIPGIHYVKEEIDSL